ncbi:hypothetical protein IVB06_31485 [Bradyrhizobium sp. 171]|nr:hypothetical protein [Bradyrhizobium sp. 176]MCK1560730.1 hypothetical protein [Bradyrhizobium sp. 171]UPK20475.1 hypothetical protein IVA73_05175 [Bradyrhizobium sp. 131]
MLAGKSSVEDVFAGCEALQGLQPPSLVLGGEKVGKVSSELIVSVMVALDGRFLDRAVHALDQAIGPEMLIFASDVRPHFLGIAQSALVLS